MSPITKMIIATGASIAAISIILIGAYRAGTTAQTPQPIPSSSQPRNPDTAEASGSSGARTAPTYTPTERPTWVLDGDESVPPPATPPPTVVDKPTATPRRTALPPGKKGVPRGQKTPDKKVDQNASESVAIAFAARLNQHDTRLDNRPNDAGRRAAVFATDALRGQMLARAPIGNPGHRWNQLAAHDGYTTTKHRLVSLGDINNTDEHAYIAVQITPTDHGEDDWTQQQDPITYATELINTEDAWKITTYRILSR